MRINDEHLHLHTHSHLYLCTWVSFLSLSLQLIFDDQVHSLLTFNSSLGPNLVEQRFKKLIFFFFYTMSTLSISACRIPFAIVSSSPSPRRMLRSSLDEMFPRECGSRWNVSIRIV